MTVTRLLTKSGVQVLSTRTSMVKGEGATPDSSRSSPLLRHFVLAPLANVHLRESQPRNFAKLNTLLTLALTLS